MATYNPQDDLMQDEVHVELVVRLTLRGDAKVSEVIDEMDYEFKHDLIQDATINEITVIQD